MLFILVFEILGIQKSQIFNKLENNSIHRNADERTVQNKTERPRHSL